VLAQKRVRRRRARREGADRVHAGASVQENGQHLGAGVRRPGERCRDEVDLTLAEGLEIRDQGRETRHDENQIRHDGNEIRDDPRHGRARRHVGALLAK
jgi:hypothetical protein